MRVVSKRAAVLFTLLIMLLFSGCMSGNIDELLRLPQPSEEYLNLQDKIDEIIASGAVYSAPSSGSYRQSVQLHDINGDGVSEALAFFNVSGEKPLKIYIFRNMNGEYKNVAIIDGDGTEIESISYSDMNGDGWTEIIVGWKMGADIQMLNIYSLRGFTVSSVAATDYTEYLTADINDDDTDELLVVRHNRSDYAGSVIAYSLSSDGETASSEARLSQGVENISKVTVGKLTANTPALFVESVYGGTGLITDIFISSGEQIENISTDDTGVSTGTIRYYTVYCRDINNDGVMEIPIPRTLPSQGENSYRSLDWYRFTKRGVGELALTTYHNYSDSWYLVIPESWRGGVTVRREDSASGERAVVFSIWNGDGQPVTDYLKIYALTGENRAVAATRGGRQVLRREDEVIYAAELIMDEENWDYVVDYQYLKENFHLIYSEWITGLT
ncbi:MAG: VCBS repeat-containing protein [Clostridiales bacterium]|nr:VCBS repeat-containing protein [Clostridiales bacterium]